MKIKKIEKKEGVYFVTFSPNVFQKLFGIKEKVERYGLVKLYNSIH
jgi:hypothetical protein